MSALTQHQLIASKHYEGPALTLAIPGSGKTTLLLHRLIYLTEEKGVDPSQILTLTFSKASATDMQTRFRERFGQSHPYPFAFMTIHRFAYDIFRQYLGGTGKQMKLLEDTKQKYAILGEIYRQINHESLTEEMYEALVNAFGKIYNLKLQEAESPADPPNVYQMFKAFHKYKRKHHLYDFDDMLLYAIKILKQNPKALAFYRDQYPFIQVDEAQDTSKLQFELIELLSAPRHNLFLVADDDQSIYGFRGAYPEYLLNFPERYHGAKQYYLPDNFRSDAYIVNASAEVIAENRERYEKTITPTREANSPIELHFFDDVVNRNTYISEALMATQGTKAVLYRNRISALSIMAALDCDFYIKDPPIQELSHWLIEDIKAFLSLAMMPQDLEAFKRIAFKMNGYISREMMNSIFERYAQRSIFDRLIELPYLEDYQVRTLEGVKARFEMLSRLRPYDAIHFIETELGYLDFLKQNSERLGFAMQYVRTRLDAYKAIAKPLNSTIAFFTKLDDLKTKLIGISADDAQIYLSTIHGAKGLEFDSVFIVDVNAHIFPGDDPKTHEEERRLFYVALTRAKDHLHLCHVEFVNGSFNESSIFIDTVKGQHTTKTLSNRTGTEASTR